MLASTSSRPSPLSLQATTRALHTYTHISLPYKHIFIDTYNTAGNSGFRTREAPDGADFHVGKYPTGHKTRILQIHQRDSPDFESLLWGNRWTHYRSFTTQPSRHRSIPTETLQNAQAPSSTVVTRSSRLLRLPATQQGDRRGEGVYHAAPSHRSDLSICKPAGERCLRPELLTQRGGFDASLAIEGLPPPSARDDQASVVRDGLWRGGAQRGGARAQLGPRVARRVCVQLQPDLASRCLEQVRGRPDRDRRLLGK